MKKPISKANIRTEINAQIVDFLGRGGLIDEVKQGLSGREMAAAPLKNETAVFQQPRAARTYIPEVIAALDERRSAGSNTKKLKSKKPKRKIIYDDFGEPLRWEWVEE